MSMLPQMAAAFAPAVLGAVGNAVGGAMNAGLGNAAGRAATAGLNTGDTYSTAKQWIKSLDPAQQQRLQNEITQEAAQNDMRNQMQSAAFGAGIMNTGANLTTERQMAMNAQQNAANNVRDQLSGLAQRSAANANAINNAMGMFSNSFR
jgi:hypothetical protein